MSSAPKDSIAAYDAQAEEWAAYLRSGKNLAQRYVEKPAMMAALPDIEGKSVLCVGCGTGEELADLATHKPTRLIGTDLSEGMIAVAKREHPDHQFMVMDMAKLEFPDKSFDFVYSSLTIHYAPDWRHILEEWSRVLKPGGEILFSTQHPLYMSASRKGRGKAGYSIRAGFSYLRPFRRLKTYGDYFRTGQTRRTHRAGAADLQLITHRKTLSEMLSEIRGARLQVIDCLEPEPTEEALRHQKRWSAMYRALPQFILFRLRKP